MSAILTVNQLEKQGIPKKNIKLSSIQYGDNKEEVKKKLSASKGQMVALVDFARIPPDDDIRTPDFWSDHHQQSEEEKKATKTKQKEKKTPPKKDDGEKVRIISHRKDEYGRHLPSREQTITRKEFRKKINRVNEAVGKTEYPSEAAHLAKVHAQNLMTGKDIEAISKIDSAKYSNLADVIDLPKDFKNKGRIERLAIITNAMLNSFLKGNTTALHKIIKNSQPSLASVYNNLLKSRTINNKQAAAIKELSKENPDWSYVDKLRSELPKDMASDVKKGSRIKEMPSLEQKRQSKQKSVEQHIDPETTKFKKGNDYVIVQSASGRNQPQRFLGSLLTKQSGERYPAQMREWSTMIQISLNPDLDAEYAKKINLPEVVDNVLDSIIKDVNTGKIKVSDKGLTKWALTKVIKPEAGGHAGIATAGGLGTLGLAPKTVREEIKRLQQYERRAKKIKKPLKDVMPKGAEQLKKMRAIKEDFAQERKMLVNEIKKRILAEVSRKLKGAKGPKGEERFKAKRKNTVKEDILWITRTMKV